MQLQFDLLRARVQHIDLDGFTLSLELQLACFRLGSDEFGHTCTLADQDFPRGGTRGQTRGSVGCIPEDGDSCREARISYSADERYSRMDSNPDGNPGTRA